MGPFHADYSYFTKVNRNIIGLLFFIGTYFLYDAVFLFPLSLTKEAPLSFDHISYIVPSDRTKRDKILTHNSR
jgi:hypothetical protein